MNHVQAGSQRRMQDMADRRSILCKVHWIDVPFVRDHIDMSENVNNALSPQRPRASPRKTMRSASSPLKPLRATLQNQGLLTPQGTFESMDVDNEAAPADPAKTLISPPPESQTVRTTIHSMVLCILNVCRPHAVQAQHPSNDPNANAHKHRSPA